MKSNKEEIDEIIKNIEEQTAKLKKLQGLEKTTVNGKYKHVVEWISKHSPKVSIYDQDSMVDSVQFGVPYARYNAFIGVRAEQQRCLHKLFRIADYLHDGVWCNSGTTYYSWHVLKNDICIGNWTINCGLVKFKTKELAIKVLEYMTEEELKIALS